MLILHLNRVKSLSNVIRDVEDTMRARELTDQQKMTLHGILNGCHNTLEALDKVLDEYYILDTRTKSFGGKTLKVWKRLKFEPDDIRDLRSRISANVGLLNSFSSVLIM
jgi:hypothetical protein